jgi:hypothetical protein
MGRIKVYCPDIDDERAPIDQLPWCAYISPFGGVTTDWTVGPDGEKRPGVQAYGFWAIPKIGAMVAVVHIAGDPRMRYYIGCIYEHFMNRNRWIGYGLGYLVILYYLAVFPRYTLLLLRDDTRLTARQWITTHLADNSIVTISDRLRLAAKPQAIKTVSEINPGAIRSLDRIILSGSPVIKEDKLLNAYNVYFLTNDLDRQKAIDKIREISGKRSV